jgi:hypothetical protein
LAPNGNGHVAVQSHLQSGNVKIHGNSLTINDVDGDGVDNGNLHLDPASGGKIKIGTISISSTTMAQSAGDLTLSADAGNIVLSPTSTKKIIADKIEIASNVMSTRTGSDLKLAPATNQDLILSPSGNGKVGVGTSSPSEMLDVAGTLKATSYDVQQSSTTPGTTFAFQTDSNNEFQTVDGLQQIIQLTAASTIMVHYQVGHRFKLAQNSNEVLGTLVTHLFIETCSDSSCSSVTSGSDDIQAARAANGVKRTYTGSSENFGSNYVTNSGFVVESKSAGYYRVTVKYLQHVEGCTAAGGGATCATPISTSDDYGGEVRNLQVMVLGAGHSL